MSLQNQSLIFAKIPTGLPTSEHLRLISSEIPSNAPAGGLLLQTLYLSLDPYMRGCMRDPKIKTYSDAYIVGKTFSNYGISRVIESNDMRFTRGDIVVPRIAKTEFSLYQVVSAAEVPLFTIVSAENGIPLTYYIGVLGMPGVTAYHSLMNVAGPVKSGETILISAAAGAVGQIVGQLAKLNGLRVVGSVGSDEKVKFVTEELGFDAAWNYKKEPDYYAAIDKYIPEGIDIYYDNVGGPILDAAFAKTKVYGRIISCGAISQYNLLPEERYGYKNLVEIFQRRLTVKGFITRDLFVNHPESVKEIKNEMAKLVEKDGGASFLFKEDITEGIENTITAFQGLLTGKNNGKVIMKFSS
ncbi:uncharacterized protein V2V93DRAFT_212778 [Kockiozyma suomiensis]|uniref:uncharacterized protein n=1 Tax=Kockiozyma suomiensis TaxID=1337062 RepID=UPI00334414C8